MYVGTTLRANCFVDFLLHRDDSQTLRIDSLYQKILN